MPIEKHYLRCIQCGVAALVYATSSEAVYTCYPCEAKKRSSLTTKGHRDERHTDIL